MFRCAEPQRCLECWAEFRKYLQFRFAALACFGRSQQDIQSLTEMLDRLLIGAPRDRPFASDSPVSDRLIFEPSLTEMLCKQLRPSFNDVRELGFEGAGDALVKILEAAAQQSVVRSILNQGVFERVLCIWRRAML